LLRNVASGSCSSDWMELLIGHDDFLQILLSSELLDFWTCPPLGILKILQGEQRFGIWIRFHPQERRVVLGPLGRGNLNLYPRTEADPVATAPRRSKPAIHGHSPHNVNHAGRPLCPVYQTTRPSSYVLTLLSRNEWYSGQNNCIV
jgi:hypothetical protein